MFSTTSKLIKKLAEKKIKICTVESCTGGLLFGNLSKVPGSSKVLVNGYITYSNQSKIDMVNVKEKTLDKYGSVSSEVAMEMAQGALKFNNEVDVSISITGIAGPGGGTKFKPVGLVWIAIAQLKNNHVFSKKYLFDGSRNNIRKSAVTESIQILMKLEN